MRYSAYYVVSTGPNHERLANDGNMYSGGVPHGMGPKNLKEFKTIGWAKRAAVAAQEKAPWLNLIVIGMLENEWMEIYGNVVRRNDDGTYVDCGYGRQVAVVVKPNFMTSLFG